MKLGHNAEQAAKGTGEAANDPQFDRLLASASAERGAQVAKQCAVCHNFEEGHVPGTAMTFANISNEKRRADVIAYLDTLSKKPVALPKEQ
jgi:cytochrome c2